MPFPNQDQSMNYFMLNTKYDWIIFNYFVLSFKTWLPRHWCCPYCHFLWHAASTTATSLWLRTIIEPAPPLSRLNKRPTNRRWQLPWMGCSNWLKTLGFLVCCSSPDIKLTITMDLNSKSPKALVMANCPPSLPWKMQPPSDLDYNKITEFVFFLFHSILCDLLLLFEPFHFRTQLLLCHPSCQLYKFFCCFMSLQMQCNKLSRHLQLQFSPLQTLHPPLHKPFQ